MHAYNAPYYTVMGTHIDKLSYKLYEESLRVMGFIVRLLSHKHIISED